MNPPARGARKNTMDVKIARVAYRDYVALEGEIRLAETVSRMRKQLVAAIFPVLLLVLRIT